MSPAKKTGAALILLTHVVAFATGIVAMDIVRDGREATQLAEITRERMFWAMQEACYPEPGQETVQRRDAKQIGCVVYERPLSGQELRMVMAMAISAPTPTPTQAKGDTP